MAGNSPTQRTLKLYRDDGYTAGITEHWNSYAKIRQDLFQFVDIIAMKPGQILAIQTTTDQNRGARLDKMRALDTCRKWLEAGGVIHLTTWRKLKVNGRPKWVPRVCEITQETLLGGDYTERNCSPSEPQDERGV